MDENWLSYLDGHGLIMIFPRVKHELKHGKKGSQKEWMGAIGVLGGVALFVWLLMKMV